MFEFAEEGVDFVFKPGGFVQVEGAKFPEVAGGGFKVAFGGEAEDCEQRVSGLAHG